jgi:hypothetical protein
VSHQFALDLLRLLDLFLHLYKLLLQLLLHPQDALDAHHEGRLKRTIHKGFIEETRYTLMRADDLY